MDAQSKPFRNVNEECTAENCCLSILDSAWVMSQRLTRGRSASVFQSRFTGMVYQLTSLPREPERDVIVNKNARGYLGRQTSRVFVCMHNQSPITLVLFLGDGPQPCPGPIRDPQRLLEYLDCQTVSAPLVVYSRRILSSLKVHGGCDHRLRQYDAFQGSPGLGIGPQKLIRRPLEQTSWKER